ncbi:MAG: hypothetical protein L0312_01245 [Acidobacteria bacterium]|nr:hypothetical protein [Acidobacteriota bacterium]
MNDWMKQSEEMFKAWSETQRRIMENWAGSVRGLGRAQGTDLWGKTLSTWQDTLEKSTKAQAEWTEKWIENLKSTQGMPQEALESTRQFQEMMRRWAVTQEQMWLKWFEMLRSLDPGFMTDKWSDAFQNPFQVWQDATKKVMDSQAEWMRGWMGSGGKPEEK